MLKERFTPAERRLAVLLFSLALAGHAIRGGRDVSPEVDAWFREGLGTRPAEDSLRTPASPGGSRVDTAGSPVRPPGPGAGLVDPNQAGLEALLDLPGVGPVLGRRILEDRERNGPFRSPEDLLRVPGIGPATLARLRPFLKLDGAGPGSPQPAPSPRSWVSPPTESGVPGKSSAPASSRKPPADI